MTLQSPYHFCKGGKNVPNESKIEHIRSLIDQCGQPYQQISDGSGVSTSTISRLMKGGGAQAGTLEQLEDYLAPYAPVVPDISPTDDSVPRAVVDVLVAQYHQQILQLASSHAAHLATIRKIARQRLRWIIVLSVALVAIVCWFLWDLTHPEVGLIRLKQAGYIIGQLRAMLGR